MSTLSFLGELYREIEESDLEIDTLYKTVKLQQAILKPLEKIDQVQTLKLLAETLINSDRLQEGIQCIKDALEIQKILVNGNMNSEVQDTLTLLAEAYTVGKDEMVNEALDTYNQLVELKTGKTT